MDKAAVKRMLPSQQIAIATPTDLWSDSCGMEDLTYAVVHGAAGASISPARALEAVRREGRRWENRVERLLLDYPEGDEMLIAGKVIEEICLRCAEALLPVFERGRGVKGRLAVPTNPVDFRNKDRLVEQALRVAALAPNVQVNIPATAVGIEAIEEATCRGISVNAVACLSLAQAVAAAEAVERGLVRRVRRGFDVSMMAPVCSVPCAGIEAWVRAAVPSDDGEVVSISVGGAAVSLVEKAYALFKSRGYRARLLADTDRARADWRALIGKDVIVALPHERLVAFNQSGADIRSAARWSAIVAGEPEGLRGAEVATVFTEGGLKPADFAHFAAMVAWLRAAIEDYRDLLGIVRDVMLPVSHMT